MNTKENRYYLQPWYTKIYRTLRYIYPGYIKGIIFGIYCATFVKKVWYDNLHPLEDRELALKHWPNTWKNRFIWTYNINRSRSEYNAGKWKTMEEVIDSIRNRNATKSNI